MDRSICIQSKLLVHHWITDDTVRQGRVYNPVHCMLALFSLPKRLSLVGSSFKRCMPQKFETITCKTTLVWVNYESILSKPSGHPSKMPQVAFKWVTCLKDTSKIKQNKCLAQLAQSYMHGSAVRKQH